MYKIENIRKVVFNGRNVKMFDVLEDKGDYYVFYGTFTAPARTANKDLVKFIGETR